MFIKLYEQFNFLFALDEERHSHLIQIACKTYINANWNFYEHIKWNLRITYFSNTLLTYSHFITLSVFFTLATYFFFFLFRSLNDFSQTHRIAEFELKKFSLLPRCSVVSTSLKRKKEKPNSIEIIITLKRIYSEIGDR